MDEFQKRWCQRGRGTEFLKAGWKDAGKVDRIALICSLTYRFLPGKPLLCVARGVFAQVQAGYYEIGQRLWIFGIFRIGFLQLLLSFLPLPHPQPADCTAHKQTNLHFRISSLSFLSTNTCCRRWTV